MYLYIPNDEVNKDEEKAASYPFVAPWLSHPRDDMFLGRLVILIIARDTSRQYPLYRS